VLTIKESGRTFDDILLAPRRSEILPSEVSLETRCSRNVAMSIPLISSPMDTVTEYKMAIALALHGGIGVIHRAMDIERQAHEVYRVKRYQSGKIAKPYTLAPHKTIGDAKKLVEERGISGIPIVKSDDTLVGLLTRRDLLYAPDDDFLVQKAMRPLEKLVVASECISAEKAYKILLKEHIEKLPLVDEAGHLRGLITLKDINLMREFSSATRDKEGRLRVAAAIGATGDFYERAIELLNHDVDMIVLDSSHGHSSNVMNALKKLKSVSGMVDIVVGNIATREAADDLIDLGADGLRVGIGGGSICTTRMVTGIGVAQISAIENVVSAAKERSVPIIADGGIRFSGDITKALAAGADAVMIGRLFAELDESPGEIVEVKGVKYKRYRGMGSEAVLKSGGSDRYGAKAVPEGVEALIPYHGTFREEIHYLLGGLRQGMGYLGCASIQDMHETEIEAQIMSFATMQESGPHDILLEKDPPNYKKL